MRNNRMKLKIYSILLVCSVVALLFAFGDRVPQVLTSILFPGAFVAVLINGSLHDRIMPGYLLMVVAFNCIFYSVLVIFGITIFKRYRASR